MTGGREQHCSRGTTFLPLQLRSAWTLARPPPLPPPLARCSPDPLCNKAPLVRTHTSRPSLPPAPLTGARAPTPLRRRRQKKRKTAEDEREGDEAPLTLTRHVHKEDTFTRTRPVQSGETNEDGQERRRKKKARVACFSSAAAADPCAHYGGRPHRRHCNGAAPAAHAKANAATAQRRRRRWWR